MIHMEGRKMTRRRLYRFVIAVVWHQEEKRGEEYIIDIWYKMHSFSHFISPATFSLASRLIRWERKKKNSWQEKFLIKTLIYQYFKKKGQRKQWKDMAAKHTKCSIKQKYAFLKGRPLIAVSSRRKENLKLTGANNFFQWFKKLPFGVLCAFGLRYLTDGGNYESRWFRTVISV